MQDKLLFCCFFIALLNVVSSNVSANHCLVDVEPLSFGDYDIFYPAPLDTQANINLQCTSNEPFRVTMDTGMNGDGSFTFRRLQSGGSTSLLYNLYLDSSRRQVWGDGNGSSGFFSGSPVQGFSRLVVYGRIAPGQRVETGLYRDSVIVTVEW